MVSTHSRPKAAALRSDSLGVSSPVSTHSRPKAAAALTQYQSIIKCCFNTQPPEGGCPLCPFPLYVADSFNTQPPEGGCLVKSTAGDCFCGFQHTAARRRLPNLGLAFAGIKLFQHTAARRRLLPAIEKNAPEIAVSTHSRPKAAAYLLIIETTSSIVSTHSRPKAAAWRFWWQK